MHRDSSRWGTFPGWSPVQRLGLTVGLVAAGASALLPQESRAQQAPPPNIMFLLDNHESMQEYPQYLPEAFTPGYYPTPINPGPGDLGGNGLAGHAINTGCSDPALVDAMSWFNKNSPDPRLNGSIPYDSDPNFGTTPQFFDPNLFLASRGWRLAQDSQEQPASLRSYFNATYGFSDAFAACWNQLGWKTEYYDSPLIKECQKCLVTQGWWRGPIVTDIWAEGPHQRLDQYPLPPEAYRKWVVSGRVLNVRPPRFVVARKVLKDVIATASHVRMGVATFGMGHDWFDPPALLEPMRPSCDQSLPTVNETALDRPRLMRAVNQTQFRNTERSTGEALFGLGGYFSSRADMRWDQWFHQWQPFNPGWGWPGCCNGGTYDDPYTGREGRFWGAMPIEWIKSSSYEPNTGAYLPGQPLENLETSRSVCTESQVNSVIVVTAGSPMQGDNTVPITRMMELLTAEGAQHPDGTPLVFNPSDPENNPDVGGINYCHLFERYPGVFATRADCDYTEYNWPHGLGVGNKNFMDDVAFFLSHMDLRGDLSGRQSVRTYVVGYGADYPMLKSMALAGEGMFFRANTDTQLREALLRMIGSPAPANSTP
ncbi:hypothetical protein [Archangium lipolyticum]|uniref:hypothetical protein n=1 Tax=Archangium lipolyticum TaxID=2970465 RepID=UPI00214A5D5D|nr:hypothetical protein [Archangium lipolyticum]